METQEGQGDNPLNRDWGASLLEAVPFDNGAVARAAGGEDYQQYRQGASSFEAAILPVLSGAAVTPSEAQRQIRANLPQLNDTPSTLQRKSHNRQLMLNAAADLAGRPRPFPDAGTWDFDGGVARRPSTRPARAANQNPPAAAAASGPPVLTPDQARAATPGTVFMTTDGRRMVRH